MLALSYLLQLLLLLPELFKMLSQLLFVLFGKVLLLLLEPLQEDLMLYLVLFLELHDLLLQNSFGRLALVAHSLAHHSLARTNNHNAQNDTTVRINSSIMCEVISVAVTLNIGTHRVERVADGKRCCRFLLDNGVNTQTRGDHYHLMHTHALALVYRANPEKSQGTTGTTAVVLPTTTNALSTLSLTHF